MNHERNLYRAEQVRELDRQVIEVQGIPGYTLMCRAGERVFQATRARWPEATTWTIACGGGNNGGDGYVVARLAQQAGLTVQLIALKSPSALGGDARQAADDWLKVGGQVETELGELRGEVIIDALLGTGLDRAAGGDYARLIEQINNSQCPVVAVDVPSGLDADTGMPLGPCVRADMTVGFIGRKRGLHTGQAGRWCGVQVFDDLGTPAAIHDTVEADARLLDAADLRDLLPARAADTHKGDLGHMLVIGGDTGMAGAAVLAGQAALQSGSGLVSLATRSAHASAALGLQPELMVHGVETLDELDALIERAGVLALGPGLGRSDWSRAVWRRALAAGRGLVVDADGLNLLAESTDADQLLPADSILTPHPGEAARLLGGSTAEVQADRYQAARTLAQRYSCVVVLKGHGSLVADSAGQVVVCPYGNPAMATAGMGDALTGIIASFLGQGLSPFDAASAGMLIHGLAGDRAAAGRRQILASDLIAALKWVLPE